MTRPDAPSLRTVALAGVPTALIALAILHATLGSAPPDLGGSHLDKLAHAGAFALLVLPLASVLPPGRALAGVALAAVALGGAIELIQPTVGRSAEWLDFWANTLGVLLALGLGQGGRWARRRLSPGAAGSAGSSPSRSSAAPR